MGGVHGREGMAAKAEAISLYRSLVRSSKQFASYNFREYFLRRTREDFRQYRGETDPTKIQELLAYGQTELQVIQRQAQISRLYAAPERSVLEERKARAAASKPAGGPSDTAAPSATS